RLTFVARGTPEQVAQPPATAIRLRRWLRLRLAAARRRVAAAAAQGLASSGRLRPHSRLAACGCRHRFGAPGRLLLDRSAAVPRHDPVELGERIDLLDD